MFPGSVGALGETEEHVLKTLASGSEIGEWFVAFGEPCGECGHGGGRGRSGNPVLPGRFLGHAGVNVLAKGNTIEPACGAEADVVTLSGAHEFGRSRIGEQGSVVDDDDSVGEFLGFIEIVGRQQNGDAGIAQVGDDTTDDLATGRVDAGGGLVEKGDLGAADQGERKGQPLLFAAGKRSPCGALAISEPDHVKEFDWFDGVVVVAGEEAEDLKWPNAGVDTARLQHHSDPGGEQRVL